MIFFSYLTNKTQVLLKDAHFYINLYFLSHLSYNDMSNCEEERKMKKMKIFKAIQLLCLLTAGILGYIFFFMKGSPSSWAGIPIPLSTVYIIFLGSLLLLLIFLLLDLLFLEKLQEEKAGLSRLTYLDSVTGGLSRLSFDIMSKKYNAQDKLSGITVYVFHLTNLVETNDRAGFLEGDRLLKNFYVLLAGLVGKEGLITRNRPDYFILLFPSFSKKDAENFAAAAERAVADGASGRCLLRVCSPYF